MNKPKLKPKLKPASPKMVTLNKPRPIIKPIAKLASKPVTKLAPPKLKLKLEKESSTVIPAPRKSKLDIEGLVDATGKPITLDPSQEDAVIKSIAGKSFSVIGKAGTGKTTIVQAMCLKWIEQNQWETISYRIKGTGQRAYAPSIAIVAFTNQAANNIRHKIQANPKLATSFGYNVTTIHNLLEYTVEWITDEATGKKTPRYYPQRDKNKKLDITHLVVEEGSMVGAGAGALWEKLYEALPRGVQIVFLGDINQLTPVIGKSILSYALQQLPVAELLTVHRTALDNPIIRQALRCLEGKDILEDYNDEKGQGVIVKHGAKSKYCYNTYYIAFKKFIRRLLDTGMYNPFTDIVLCPYYKQSEHNINATTLGKHIANILAETNEHLIYEIKSGFNTIYLAVGDRVVVDKEEGIVTDISPNSGYTGEQARPPSSNMDYFGNVAGKPRSEELEHYDYSAMDIDAMLNNVDDEERKRTASHSVTIKIINILEGEDDKSITLTSVSDVGNIALGYATSVHKAQGSEYPTTIVAMHDTNIHQLCRESLYTAMTRAQRRLIILAQQQVMRKALRTQRIKGSNLAAKIEYFNNGYLDQKIDIIPGVAQ